MLWLVFAFSCFVLLFIVLIADETWYDRALPVQPERQGGIVGRILLLTGVTGFRERHLKPKVFPSVMRTLEVYTKPVMWLIFLIYALAFMWAVGINITSSINFSIPRAAGGYGLSLTSISVLYLTPIIALIIGEFIGHFLNDFVANRYVRKHNGLFKPEARLSPFFLAAFLMIPGLVIVGQALARQLNIGAVVMGWGMYVVGVMISSVAITSFARLWLLAQRCGEAKDGLVVVDGAVARVVRTVEVAMLDEAGAKVA